MIDRRKHLFSDVAGGGIDIDVDILLWLITSIEVVEVFI